MDASAGRIPAEALVSLHRRLRPRALRRADRGQPRKVSIAELERYCEIVATAGGQGLTSSTSMIIVSVQSFSRLATSEREPFVDDPRTRQRITHCGIATTYSPKREN